MRSRIELDIVDFEGSGLEPVIRVDLNPSGDPRDKLLRALFHSITGKDSLEVIYTGNEREETEDGQPQFRSTIFLRNPKN